MADAVNRLPLDHSFHFVVYNATSSSNHPSHTTKTRVTDSSCIRCGNTVVDTQLFSCKVEKIVTRETNKEGKRVDIHIVRGHNNASPPSRDEPKEESQVLLCASTDIPTHTQQRTRTTNKGALDKHLQSRKNTKKKGNMRRVGAHTRDTPLTHRASWRLLHTVSVPWRTGDKSRI